MEVRLSLYKKLNGAYVNFKTFFVVFIFSVKRELKKDPPESSNEIVLFGDICMFYYFGFDFFAFSVSTAIESKRNFKNRNNF